jgi:hypothetical protein
VPFKPRTPDRDRFARAISAAMHQLGSDRDVEKASGVDKSVWYDTKSGRSVPRDNWPKMRDFLLASRLTDSQDWDALYSAAVGTGQKPASARNRTVPPDRLYTAASTAMTAFALPAMPRLHLLDRALEDDDTAVPGRICYLLGEGGLGKSVLLGQLAAKLSTAETKPAVVVIACNRIRPGAVLSSGESADIAFGRAAGLRALEPGLRRLMHRLRQAYGSVFLLVDTLDLVLTSDTAAPVTAVLADAAEHAQVFVSCRLQEYQDLLADPDSPVPRLGYREAEAVALPKLDVPEIVGWASAYVRDLDLTDENRKRFLASLSDRVLAATVREVCAVPLRLALACKLYGDEGVMPSDLTITGLYEAYWERRICRDRLGRRTERGDAQEVAALWLARTILRQSSSRLSLTVSANAGDAPRRTSLAMAALISEGLVRYQVGRYEFFHQTYAEFAVARLLNGAGSRTS